MIAEEAKRIKAFGSDRECFVTPEDISAKEAQLGIRLPEVFVKLYFTFHENDLVFSDNNYFVPLHQLEIIEQGAFCSLRNQMDSWIFRVKMSWTESFLFRFTTY